MSAAVGAENVRDFTERARERLARAMAHLVVYERVESDPNYSDQGPTLDRVWLQLRGALADCWESIDCAHDEADELVQELKKEAGQ